MVGVVGFWEDNARNVNSGLDFYLDMWRECVKPFGVVDLALVDGRVLVRDGRITTVEMEPVVERHNAIARQLVRGE